MMTDKSKVEATIEVDRSKSASAIIDNYLALKDALVQEDSKGAAGFCKKLLDGFAKFDFTA